MESAVRRADADPVDTKFGPPSIVRPKKAQCDCCQLIVESSGAKADQSRIMLM